MKKVTLILSMFVIGFAGQAFAQSPASAKVKMPAGKDDNAILIGLLLPAVQKVNSSAKPQQAEAKPISKNTASSPQAPHVKVFDGKTGQPAPLLLPAVQKVREAAVKSSNK